MTVSEISKLVAEMGISVGMIKNAPDADSALEETIRLDTIYHALRKAEPGIADMRLGYIRLHLPAFEPTEPSE